MSALQRAGVPAKRAVWRRRAASTLLRDLGRALRADGVHQLLARGRLHAQDQVDPVQQRPAQLCPVAPHRALRAVALAPAASPWRPHGQGLLAASSMKRAGKLTVRCPRVITMWPSSRGWRSASSASRLNSGELVEEQHAVTGEARLAGGGHRATADQSGARDRMMRSTEGPPRDERAPSEHSGHAVHARDVERLLHGHRRQDRGHPAREHRLAAPRRPDIRTLWPPAAATSIARLSAKCPRTCARSCSPSRIAAQHRRVDRRLGRSPAARQETLELRHALDADHVEPRDQRCLVRVGARQDQALTAGPPGGGRNRERPPHGPHRAVQAELAADRVARQPLGLNLPAGREQRRRQGEVESRPRLAQVGGSEVDGDAPQRELEPGVDQRRPHALARLLHRGVGQADDRERRQARMDVRLDGDLDCVDTAEREGRRREASIDEPYDRRFHDSVSHCQEIATVCALVGTWPALTSPRCQSIAERPACSESERPPGTSNEAAIASSSATTATREGEIDLIASQRQRRLSSAR